MPDDPIDLGCIPSVDSDIPPPLRPTAFAIHRALCPLDGYYLTTAPDSHLALYAEQPDCPASPAEALSLQAFDLGRSAFVLTVHPETSHLNLEPAIDPTYPDRIVLLIHVPALHHNN